MARIRTGEESLHCTGIRYLVQSLDECLGFENQGQEVISLLYHLKLPPPLVSLHPPRSPKRDFAQQVK